MRLGAVLLSLHVAVGPLKIKRVRTIVLFAKPGGATGPYLSLYTTCRVLNGFVVSALVSSFLASFEALRERKVASNA